MPSDFAAPPPPPALDHALAAAFLRKRYGLKGTLHDLGSNQDRNLLLESGDERFLLKVANPAIPAGVLAAQTEAVARLAEHLHGVRLPRVRPDRKGRLLRDIDLDGTPAIARVLDFVPGRTLSGGGYLSPSLVRAMGSLAARIDLALAEQPLTGLEDTGQWDLRNAGEVVDALIQQVPRRAARPIRAAAAQARAVVDALAEALPVQLVHGDLTDDNVVVGDGPLPDGVIDFGDLGAGWAVGELAVTISSLLHHADASAPTVLRAAAAYDSVRPLSGDEVEALWPLVVLRAAVLVVSAHDVLAHDPGNDYARENLEHERVIFERATAAPLPVMQALVRRTLGRAPTPPTAALGTARILAGLDHCVVDLSPESAVLDGGRWLDDESRLVADAMAAEASADRSPAAVLRYGERRLTRARPRSAHEPETTALGVEVHLAAPTTLLAPFDAEVVAGAPGGVTLATADVRLRLDGVEDAPDPGTAVAAGAVIGVAPAVLRAQAAPRALEVDPPWFARPSWADAWLDVLIDPTPLLLGTTLPAPRPDATVLDRRRAHLADVQEHYFDEPPTMLRGWREHLVDDSGRVHLDVLNNVSSIGHGHPLLADRVARQWRLLNTNSRFSYPAIGEFCERLAALLPDGLDSVLLVNSGTEATDLALRIARAWSGRDDVVAVREAYHGWSGLSDAVSTSVADNPDAVGTRPPWVHVLDAPNSYRGVHRGTESHKYAEEAVARIEQLARTGTPPGGFIAETYYGNAGGIPLPDGYLEAVYAAVRAHGGLCIADEVQVGYGRLGDWFWGFEQQGVVPDVVAVAKAMGNGHPLGAVVTTRAVAEHYRSEGYFFSSAGGSPVSSVVGSTVLDVIESEGLQENARVVGAHLRARLEELAARHPLIGAVHGNGLYLGLELVRDRETLEPATEETRAICERLRERGVIVQPTSDRQCVLKIKPPLCFTRESADFFADQLDEVLTTGW
ncbi:hydroxylysine kinase /5-phosphonooxy-L-lysine phospho-lyase apoenzyme [Rathayibacter oskolensis]|uniref:Hydroxylysine kinase /5-phosphonooxy-L-lysine phospho-lyase apoenzyme n=1 Tax=Rathayibacter oskolensis TaxID=1891671 RepID=A0A1X7N739_9MICO|nr:aminotransferase [Rathayibacter oskolensis]SMH32317.1 hydroxylysine kinase /5-phosphonooxy-L-lysine phospho-lyase apoenzyme [Rathayibacter oskolensis]